VGSGNARISRSTLFVEDDFIWRLNSGLCFWHIEFCCLHADAVKVFDRLHALVVHLSVSRDLTSHLR